MPRIRSVHPGQWTDDEFVQMSPWAQLLAIAVRNFTDDNGIFEWNPVKLKMWCLPAATADVAKLLAEMVQFNQVRRFTAGGRDYGQVRNFARFQRIKKPTFIYPEPADFPTGYELSRSQRTSSSEPDADDGASSSEPVPHRPRNRPAEVGDAVLVVGGAGPSIENPSSAERGRSLALAPPPIEGDLLAIPPSLERRRASRLPEGWVLPDEWRHRAIDARHRHGMPAINLDLEAEKFANYWRAQPGAKGTKLDWAATWQNWALRADGGGRHVNGAQMDDAELERQLDRRMGGR